MDPLHTGRFITPPSGGGHLVGTAGTELFTLNSDSTETNGDGDDPILVVVEQSAPTNFANVEVSVVPEGCNHLDLFHRYVGADPSTDPIIRVYGRTANGDWYPCFDSDGAVDITIENAVMTDSTNSFEYRGGQHVFLAGAKQVAVLVGTASDPGTSGLILGRFVM